MSNLILAIAGLCQISIASGGGGIFHGDPLSSQKLQLKCQQDLMSCVETKAGPPVLKLNDWRVVDSALWTCAKERK